MPPFARAFGRARRGWGKCLGVYIGYVSGRPTRIPPQHLGSGVRASPQRAASWQLAPRWWLSTELVSSVTMGRRAPCPILPRQEARCSVTPREELRSLLLALLFLFFRRERSDPPACSCEWKDGRGGSAKLARNSHRDQSVTTSATKLPPRGALALRTANRGANVAAVCGKTLR